LTSLYAPGSRCLRFSFHGSEKLPPPQDWPDGFKAAVSNSVEMIVQEDGGV